MIDPVLVARIRHEVSAALPAEDLLRSYADPVQRRLLRERVRAAARGALDDAQVDLLCADLFGFGPLQRFLDDPSVTDVLVNDAATIFVERHGILERVRAAFTDHQQLSDLTYRIAASVGRELTVERPFVDARMRDGSRANAVVAPVGGPTLCIRKFRSVSIPLRGERSWASAGLQPEWADHLERAVAKKANVIVTGPTGSGKSTLVRSLAAFIPHSERVIVIEDTNELVLPHPHVVHLECVPGRDGGIGVADLVANALRMRPDRIVVGEVRTPREAFALLEALSTGHRGTLTSLHANSAVDSIVRLELLLARAGELSGADLRRHILRAVDLVVHVSRHADGRRRIVEIASVTESGPEVVWRSA